METICFILYIEPCITLCVWIFPGGGYNISPLKPRNGRARAQVQHLMQIDLKGWGVGYVSSFQQHCLLQMLNSVAGEFLPLLLICKIWSVIACWYHFSMSLLCLYLTSLCFGYWGEVWKEFVIVGLEFGWLLLDSGFSLILSASKLLKFLY